MLRTTARFGVTLLLPAAVWSVLALGLASILPTPPDEHPAVPAILWQGEHGSAVVLAGPNPCTGRPAVVNATVNVRVTAVGDGDDVQVQVEAAFENAVGATAYDRLRPITERYAFTWPGAPAPASPAHVERLRVPVDDRLIGSHLAVALAASTDADGRVSVVPTDIQLVCSMPYYEGNPEQ